jgi:1,4-alpha-glucan branching enzyme
LAEVVNPFPSGVDDDHVLVAMACFLRKGKTADALVLVACNFTPVPRHNYRIGVPRGGRWAEILNSEAPLYGGSGQGNLGGVMAAPVAWHGRSHLLSVTLPPLGIVMFKALPTGETEVPL